MYKQLQLTELSAISLEGCNHAIAVIAHKIKLTEDVLGLRRRRRVELLSVLVVCSSSCPKSSSSSSVVVILALRRGGRRGEAADYRGRHR